MTWTILVKAIVRRRLATTQASNRTVWKKRFDAAKLKREEHKYEYRKIIKGGIRRIKEEN